MTHLPTISTKVLFTENTLRFPMARNPESQIKTLRKAKETGSVMYVGNLII